MKLFKEFLGVMNDITFLPGLHEEFKRDEGFQTSLLRDKDARFALESAYKITLGSDLDVRNFTFQVILSGALKPHHVDFNFDVDSELPSRLAALIGKNGTGKTGFLSRLALALGGSHNDDSVSLQFPPFNKVIAISYSPFDEFKIPERTRRYNYCYCGLRIVQSDRLRSKSELLKLLKSYCLDVVNERKDRAWKKILRSVVEETTLNKLYDEFIDNADRPVRPDFGIEISSGQLAQILIYTQLIAFMRPRSLVLFDEPELHTHPTALSNLVRELHDMLDQYDSFAIIATHSPIVIQEVPSKHVIIFDRIGNVPIVRKLPIESFGENLTNITEEIFGTVGIEANYKKVFNDLKERGMLLKEVEELFEGRLGLNAHIYLSSIYKRRN
jgi:ABC-type dipeptide/oligopeptide/nickel transport system ATPase component